MQLNKHHFSYRLQNDYSSLNQVSPLAQESDTTLKKQNNTWMIMDLVIVEE